MNKSKTANPFWVIVRKEISDFLRSWKSVILIIIILITCLASLYVALTNIGDAVKKGDVENDFLFLKLFTISDGAMPSFAGFISLLGPLLGIAMGFDAINSEQNKGTLSRLLSQPIYRDYVINAKGLAALIVIGSMIFALGFLVIGFGLIFIGIPPTAEEFLRIIIYLLLSLVYIALWLNIAVFFSVISKQPATSALACIAVWLFFNVFYSIIMNVVAKELSPSMYARPEQVLKFQNTMLILLRLSPSELFQEITTTILVPAVRSTGLLTYGQLEGAIPNPLSLGQSLLVEIGRASCRERV